MSWAGDPLEGLREMIPWEDFRQAPEEDAGPQGYTTCNASSASPALRPRDSDTKKETRENLKNAAIDGGVPPP